jgi:RNA polymerase sigma-70 factor (ECF subfamily)
MIGMRENGERGGELWPVMYCLVPRDLAPRLHEVLRRRFADDPSIEVVVERRSAERRGGGRRRSVAASSAVSDRRRIRVGEGRRVGERRAALVVVDAPELPRRARPHAARLVFVERLEPSGLHAEDVDTARLVARIQAGDRDSFAVLYLRYFDRVYGYLRVVFRDHDAAEDLTQQIFLAALEALPRYEIRDVPFRAWLFSIVRRRALTWLKRRQRLDVLDPTELARLDDERPPSPAPEVLDWLSDHELLLFVERLPVAQRQVLLLRYMLDFDHRTIAEVLGLSPENVRVLHHRALRYLRARLTALGRHPSAPSREPQRIRGCLRQAPVTRARRFALIA